MAMWLRLDDRLAAAAVSAGVASMLGLVGPIPVTMPAAGADPAVAGDDFVITGEVGDLYPGQRTTIDTQVTNTQPFTLRVTSVEVSADDAMSGCPGSLLSFDPIAAPVDVVAGATGPVPVPVELDFDTPEACIGASWPLTFVASAVQVGPAQEPPSSTTTSTTVASSTGGPGLSTPEQAGPSAEAPASVAGRLARTGLDVVAFVVAGGLLLATGISLRHLARHRVS